MSTDKSDPPTTTDLEEAFPRVAELEQRLREADIDLDDLPQKEGTTRRDLLKAAGVAGTAGLVGAGGMNAATQGAQAGTQSTGTIGTAANPVDVEAEDINATAINAEDLSNVHILSEVSGSTLNAKWDTLRSGFTTGASKCVIVPPPKAGDAAAVETSPGVWAWEVDSPLVIDDPENNLDLHLGWAGLAPTTAVTSLIEISPTNKTEGVTIHGGRFSQYGGNATYAIQGHGGSKISLLGPQIGSFDGTTWTKGIDWPSDVAPTGELRIERWTVGEATDASIHLQGVPGNGATMNTIARGRGGGTNVVIVEGIGRNNIIEEIHGRSSAQPPTNAVVKLMTSGTSNEPHDTTVRDITTDEGIDAVQVRDGSAGSADKIQGLAFEGRLDGGAGVGGSMIDIDYASGPHIDIGNNFGSGDIIIGSGTSGARIDAPDATVTDNGTSTQYAQYASTQ